MEFDKQAAWSICYTHNMDSQQFPTALPRSVSLDQADRSYREPPDGCVTLGQGRQCCQQDKSFLNFCVFNGAN